MDSADWRDGAASRGMTLAEWPPTRCGVEPGPAVPVRWAAPAPTSAS